jgi:beta-N-acetylhexosaminidase
MKRVMNASSIVTAVAICILGAAASSPSQQTGRAAIPEFPGRLAKPDTAWVDKTLREMSMREKVGQLLQIRVMGHFLNRQSAEYQALRQEILENRVGGAVLFAGNVYESAVLLNDLQGVSRLPLIVSADFERGASFRIEDTTSFPWTMAIGATGSEDLAYKEGAITAREARALGVHWIYAPVVDVNNNPDNPVINIRSFGEDPQLVARLGAAFIRGAHENGVLTTAKHFPGHGDTATDSHLGLPVISSDRSRLEEVELVPFRQAIAAGVDSVMTAHVAVPQLTGEPGVPATLSPRILTDLLRNSLHFQGLIVTDALEMGGITTRYWTGLAAIRALKAGADMLVLPPDSGVALNEVVRAVRRGDIPERQIDRSVRKILEAKTRLGLHRNRIVPIGRIREVVASPESRKVSRQIADASITLLKDDKHLLPLNPVNPPKIFSLAVASDLDTAPAAVFQAEMKRRFPSCRTMSMDPRISEELMEGISNASAEADVLVVASIVRVISGKGNFVLKDEQRFTIEGLLASGKPVIWVALGSPYVLRAYPQASACICAFSYADVSQLAAARAVSGEIAISGKTPVSIPGLCKAGDGLAVPRLDMTLHRAAPETAGLPQDAFREVEGLLTQAVESKAFPGAALIVGYRGAVILDTAAGSLDYSPGSPRVTGDTIYDLASVSKAASTTSAAMMLVESGDLLLSARVQDYVPEFEGANKEKVLVQHLLTHSSGLPGFLQLYKEARGYDQVLAKVCAAPLEFEPGAKTQYSDLGMILLGEIIRRASGRPQDQFVAQNLFGPLGMKSTFYRPDRSFLKRIAPTENDPWRKRVVRGEVHDENAFAMGGVAGHAGLFSTTHDLAVFAQMLLNGGIYDHHRYLSAETIKRFTARQSDDRGLGWGKPSESDWTGKALSSQAYKHTGFTGTSIWVDPQKQLFIILLSNRVHPTRENTRIDQVNQAIVEAVVRVIPPPAAEAPH